MQVTEIGLGNSATDTSLLKLEYGYGSNTENNGNLKTQKISFNGLSQPFEQTYTYDSLNRLKSATETVVGVQNPTWKQTFDYDRYGNRRFDANNTTTLGSCSQVQCNPLINTSDNRFSLGQNYSYDENGNLTRDTNSKKFTYDAENHQIKVETVDANGNAIATNGEYLYDGEGKRIKKISSTETVIFVYDGGGQLVAEYSTQTVTTPQVSYLTADHLGSPRVITNQNGKVTTRKDYMAFGDEASSAQRTNGLSYDSSETRKGYTGYEKDAESGLEFAQARYYNSQHGRFTSVDPMTGSASIKNPQTFNRYSYVLNSPYKFVDPLGLISSSTGACGSWCPGSGGGGGYSSNYDSGHRAGREGSIIDEYNRWQEVRSSQPQYLWVAGNSSSSSGTPVQNQQSQRQNSGNTGGPNNNENTLPNRGVVIVADGEPGTVENVGRNFLRSAETMKADLEALGYTVLYFGTVNSVSGFQGLLDMAKKYNAESIYLFTHGASGKIYLGDGVPNDTNTINSNSVKKLVNQAPYLVSINIYACNVGKNEDGIASQLSKQLGVLVYAPTGDMIFSNKPNEKSGLTVHPNTGPTYMVNDGGKWRLFDGLR